jgi:hypothetical protein
VPIRLIDPDEEDVPEDIEADELMRLLGPLVLLIITKYHSAYLFQ